jgi:histidine ammonia-lyase
MIRIDGDHLSIEQIVEVARKFESVDISPAGIEKIEKSKTILEKILETGRPVYGINTGFGIFADRRIPLSESNRLSRNLILSHSVGTGAFLPVEVVRAAMLVRANTLTKGFSGVRLEIVTTLLEMLNRGVTPAIPEQGSLGSSGDLGPLSHLALVFTTDDEDREDESGWAFFEDQLMTGKQAMRSAGIPRLILGPKEGLAINNGATFCAALASLAVFDVHALIELATRAVGMSLEALLGCSAAFDHRLHEARGQTGQIEIAQQINETYRGSDLINCANRVQDAYSLRCAPQVHGAVLDTVRFVSGIIEREINAATDNPLLFEPDVALSGGNFHGEPIGLVMDYLGIAAAELGSISERRTFRLLDGHLNGNLPSMLVDTPEAAGLNSGLMMPHYSAVSLVLENQTLAHPDSVHSLPTSGGQEDHNANAMTAARHARRIVENTRHVLAIELYTAARALDLRMKQYPEARLGSGTQQTYEMIRSVVPYRSEDAWWGPEVEIVKKLIETGSFG